MLRSVNPLKGSAACSVMAVVCFSCCNPAPTYMSAHSFHNSGLYVQRIRVEEILQHPWLLGQQLELPEVPPEQSPQSESEIYSIVERARKRRLQQRNSHKLNTVHSGIARTEE